MTPEVSPAENSLHYDKMDKETTRIVDEWTQGFPGAEMGQFIREHVKELLGDLRQHMVNITAKSFEDGYRRGYREGQKQGEKQSQLDKGSVNSNA